MNRSPNLAALAAALVPLVALVAPAARADEPLTLADAVAQALDRAPALAAARARVAQAEETIGEARSAHGPVISANLLGTLNRKPVPVTPIHGFGPDELPDFDDTQVQGALQLDYTLLDSGARRERVRQADARALAERSSLDAVEQGIASQVAALYARILADDRALAAQGARTEALRAELDRVEQRLAVGRAPEVDRLRAEAELATAEADAARATTDLDLDERALARYLDLPVERTRAARLRTVGEMSAPPAPRDQLEQEALAASPGLAAARAAVDAATAGQALARTAYFPKLRTSGAYQQLGGAELSFQTEWNASLKLVVPLWDGGATDRRVARAGAQRDEAAAALAQAELDARAAVDRALGAWSDASARSEALARAETRLVEVARIQKLLLDVGSGTQIDYLAAESELASTRAALARVRSDALAARFELARVTGELSLDWLVRNLETPR